MQKSKDNEMELMFEVIKRADPIYQPSSFWDFFNKKNILQLQKLGYSNFKRTVNQNYFGPLIRFPLYDQFLNLFFKWLKHPNLEVFGSTFEWNKNDEIFNQKFNYTIKFGKIQRFFHKLFLCMLWEHVKRKDKEKLLEKLEEPLEGNPYKILYNGKLVSQDLCNSILEYYSIKPFLPKTKKLAIAELGAGYGRNAYIFLKTANCKYAIFDIPPALFVSQKYLSKVFPKLKIFKFRDFKKYNEIKSEYEKADICFFTPNQIELLPKKQFNLFLNISSLHEMTLAQIKHYFCIIDKYCNGCFYSKQWMSWKNNFDKITITHKDYPVPDNWEKLFFRKHEIQKLFFEAMYKIKL